MKRTRIFLAVFLSLCCFAGCGNNDNESSSEKFVDTERSSISNNINDDNNSSDIEEKNSEENKEESEKSENNKDEQVIYESNTTRIIYIDVPDAPTSSSAPVFYLEFENLSEQDVEIEFGRTSLGNGGESIPSKYLDAYKVYLNAGDTKTLEFTLGTFKDNEIKSIGIAKTQFIITNENKEVEKTGVVSALINKEFS